MAIWLETIQFGLKEVKELFSRQEMKKAKSYEAVEAVYEAANETTSFLQECMRKVEQPNKDLSKIWMDAAKKVRDLDSELYFRLLGKAEYWADPTAWTHEKIVRANIALDSIKEDSRQILSLRK
tara:strand:+ start:244 stop:615 length:372 start_codon:yes stop_codon:yes gene_type:complete